VRFSLCFVVGALAALAPLVTTGTVRWSPPKPRSIERGKVVHFAGASVVYDHRFFQELRRTLYAASFLVFSDLQPLFFLQKHTFINQTSQSVHTN
jgi:hypothetical protein